MRAKSAPACFFARTWLVQESCKGTEIDSSCAFRKRKSTMTTTKHSSIGLGAENGETNLPHNQNTNLSCTAGMTSNAFRIASLLFAMTLVRPAAAAVFDCTQDITETCLRTSMNTANKNYADHGEANTILLGLGNYQLTGVPATLPAVTSPMTIRGWGAGNTQIHGT